MKGLGTLANFLAVIVGSGLGILIKNKMKQRFSDTLMQACGLAVMFIGAAGALSGLLEVSGKSLVGKNTMLLVGSLAIGAVLGEAIDIESKMDALGERIKKAVHAEGDKKFVEGFVTSSLVICIGAMAIVGSIQDGLTGDASTLYIKALLDLIVTMVFASALGVGVMFSSIPILIYQGGITLLAVFVSSFVSESLIANLSFVGSVLIFAVGVNLSFGKKFKVANLLPALLIPILYEIFKGCF